MALLDAGDFRRDPRASFVLHHLIEPVEDPENPPALSQGPELVFAEADPELDVFGVEVLEEVPARRLLAASLLHPGQRDPHWDQITERPRGGFAGRAELEQEPLGQRRLACAGTAQHQRPRASDIEQHLVGVLREPCRMRRVERLLLPVLRSGLRTRRDGQLSRRLRGRDGLHLGHDEPSQQVLLSGGHRTLAEITPEEEPPGAIRRHGLTVTSDLRRQDLLRRRSDAGRRSAGSAPPRGRAELERLGHSLLGVEVPAGVSHHPAMPGPLLVERPRPDPERTRQAFHVDATRAVAVDPLLRSVAPGLQAEERWRLNRPLRCGSGHPFELRHGRMHVAEEVREEPARRGDMLQEVLLRFGMEPLQRVMRQEQGHVDAPGPPRWIAVANGLELTWIQVQVPLVIPALKLQKRGIESDHPQAETALFEADGPVARQNTLLQLHSSGQRMRPGPGVEPRLERRKGFLDELSVLIGDILKEHLTEVRILVPIPHRLDHREPRTGPHEVMVARNRDEERLGSKFLQMPEELPQRVRQPVELPGRPLLGEIAREEHEVPRPRLVVQPPEILEECITYRGPHPILVRKAPMQIAQMQPADG
jgi:hypothetical protein